MVLKRKFLLVLLVLLLSSSLFALNVPELKGRVNDYANVINSSTEKQLDEYLTALDNQTGVQMVVLTVPSLNGEDIASFGIKVADAWQIGHKGEDNGALLIVAMEEHDVRIEVGYGLEGTLTDAKCGLIIRNVIIPEFRMGDYSEGILKGIKNMGGIASGDAELVEDSVEYDREENGDIVGIIVMVIWLIFMFTVISSKGGLWKWIFLSQMMGNNHSHRGPYVPPKSDFKPTNFGSGFGSSSSFGGGSSFHGGGGHFGGGGASGHW